ncbi:MAG: disulfide bond formation protein B, partial [Pseudomonadota bacterium]
MSQKQLILIAGLGSALLLLGAWGFQMLGYAPCKMCIWQRYPHGAAIAFAALAVIAAPVVLWAILGALAALTTAGIGAFHTGVEQGWWDGPASCTSSGGLGSNLLPGQAEITVVLCDEVTW